MGFAVHMRARHNDRPNRVRYPADRLFTSSCSPPFLSKTQLLSVNRCRSTYVGTFTLQIKRLRRRTCASPSGLAIPRSQEPVVHTTGRGCTSPPGLEQPKRAPESNGFQAWKAGTPSLSILFRSPMLEQDRWRCRISRSRRPRTIHHRFLRRKRSPGRYAMNSSKDLIRTG